MKRPPSARNLKLRLRAEFGNPAGHLGAAEPQSLLVQTEVVAAAEDEKAQKLRAHDSRGVVSRRTQTVADSDAWPKTPTTLASAARSGWKSARLQATTIADPVFGAFSFMRPASVAPRFCNASSIQESSTELLWTFARKSMQRKRDYSCDLLSQQQYGRRRRRGSILGLISFLPIRSAKTPGQERSPPRRKAAVTGDRASSSPQIDSRQDPSPSS